MNAWGRDDKDHKDKDEHRADSWQRDDKDEHRADNWHQQGASGERARRAPQYRCARWRR